MTIIPKEVFKNIRRIQIRTTRTVNDMLAGAYHSAFKGRGMEFEEVREYIPGDEVKSIDWNVTARMNHPYVKNFREERELTVMLLVDVSGSSLFGSTTRTKHNFIAEIGAVLAFSATHNNDKVGLLLFSDQIEKYIPPKKGVRHVLRVIRELLVFEPRHAKTNIAEALSFLGKVQKRKGVCFLISDFIASGYSREVTLTAKRHDLIAIAVRDPIEETFPDIGLATIRDLETGAEQIIDTSDPNVRKRVAEISQQRRTTYKNVLHKVGAGLIEIRTDEAYADRIREHLKRRERRQ